MKRTHRLLLTALAVPLLTLWCAALGTRGATAALRPVRINAVPPELTPGQWLNTPELKPLTLASLKGKVTVVHFWTFG